jgi:ureidoglycolate lyase
MQAATRLTLTAQDLTAQAFAPFGDVFCRLAEPGRHYTESALGNSRPQAWPSLSMVHKLPFNPLPLEVLELERHAHSSQSFVPVDAGRWLIVVAPHLPAGGPDVGRACAFVANASQGVTYRANTWHHGLTVLDQPAHFAIFMWRDGTAGDEEFVSVTPFHVVLAE